MLNRAAAFASAMLISSLAGVGLTLSANAAPTTESNTVAAADECLAAPKAETPKGAHWFYRLEKGTKRKCWYLGDQVAKANKTASSSPTPSADPAPPRAPEPAMQRSVANARAELATAKPLAVETSEDATLNETIWPSQPDSQGANVQPENSQGDSAQTSEPKNWAIASRWPDPSVAGTNDNRSPAQSETPAQNAAPQPALTADKLTTAAAHPNQASLSSTSMLLVVLAGALALVAIIGRVIVKYAGDRRRASLKRNQRRNIWDTVPEESAPLAYESGLQPRKSQFVRELSEPSNPSDEIEKLLLRASKRAAA